MRRNNDDSFEKFWMNATALFVAIAATYFIVKILTYALDSGAAL